MSEKDGFDANAVKAVLIPTNQNDGSCQMLFNDSWRQMTPAQCSSSELSKRDFNDAFFQPIDGKMFLVLEPKSAEK
jgi:hypothetical protein